MKKIAAEFYPVSRSFPLQTSRKSWLSHLKTNIEAFNIRFHQNGELALPFICTRGNQCCAISYKFTASLWKFCPHALSMRDARLALESHSMQIHFKICLSRMNSLVISFRWTIGCHTLALKDCQGSTWNPSISGPLIRPGAGEPLLLLSEVRSVMYYVPSYFLRPLEEESPH